MPKRELSRAENRLASLEKLAKSFKLAGDVLLAMVAELREEMAEEKVKD
jgi:hypothetical protein